MEARLRPRRDGRRSIVTRSEWIEAGYRRGGRTDVERVRIILRHDQSARAPMEFDRIGKMDRAIEIDLLELIQILAGSMRAIEKCVIQTHFGISATGLAWNSGKVGKSRAIDAPLDGEIGIAVLAIGVPREAYTERIMILIERFLKRKRRQ